MTRKPAKRASAENTAKIGVTKIVTLGRKKFLIAEFDSQYKPADGEYQIAQIKVVPKDVPEKVGEVVCRSRTCFNLFRPNCTIKTKMLG
jgi:hypothetical protein